MFHSISRPMNEKEISNFGSAQSHKQTDSARGRPRSGNDALLLREQKNDREELSQLRFLPKKFVDRW
jgi:hypothetical protein